MASVIVGHPDSGFSGYLRAAGRGLFFTQGFTEPVDLTAAQQTTLTSTGFTVDGQPDPPVPDPFPQYLTEDKAATAVGGAGPLPEALRAAFGGRTATVVVAASDTPLPLFADFVCDGTDDQVTINAALASLGAAGGKVKLREGQYNCSGPVVIDRDFVDLEGIGHPMWGGYITGYTPSTPAGAEGFGGTKLKATATGVSLIEFRNANQPSGTGADTMRHRGLRVASMYLYGYQYTGTAIRTNYASSAASGHDWVVLEDLKIQRSQHGIDVQFDATVIRHNSIQDVAGDGIRHAGNYGQVTGNLVYDIGGTGIVDTAFSPVISINTVGDCLGDGIVSSGPSAAITGNAVKGVRGTHIAASGRSAAITGNTVDTGDGGQGTSATAVGVSVAGASSVVSGNSVHAGGTTSGYGIVSTVASAVIVGNALSGNWNNGASSRISAPGSVVASNGGHTAGPVSVTSASLFGWWTAADIALTDGAAVTSWPDRAASDRALAPNTSSPTYVTGAINGKPAVRFNGTTDAMYNTAFPVLNQPITAFIVAKRTAATATIAALLNSAIVSDEWTAALLVSDTQNIGAYAGEFAVGPAATSTNPNIYEAVFSGTNSVLAVNGTSSTVNAGTDPWSGGVTVGANAGRLGEWFNGDVAEVIVYSGALSSADRAAVRAALGSKYAITVV